MRRWRSVAALAFLLSGCAPAAATSVSQDLARAGLGAASSGICGAISALPDVSAAERAFTNQAHDALHALAAESRLARAVSALVLEAMEEVEADFKGPVDPTVLAADLAGLRASTDSALQTLDVDVPACEP